MSRWWAGVAGWAEEPDVELITSGHYKLHMVDYDDPLYGHSSPSNPDAINDGFVLGNSGSVAGWDLASEEGRTPATGLETAAVFAALVNSDNPKMSPAGTIISNVHLKFTWETYTPIGAAPHYGDGGSPSAVPLGSVTITHIVFDDTSFAAVLEAALVTNTSSVTSIEVTFPEYPLVLPNPCSMYFLISSDEGADDKVLRTVGAESYVELDWENVP